MRYLGRIVSARGCRLDPKAVEAVNQLRTRTPKTIGEVRQLLGMLNCFRRYIQDYSKRASPLFKLLHSSKEIKDNVKSSGVKSSKKTSGQLASNTRVSWEIGHQLALDDLLSMLVTPHSGLPRL